MSMMGAETVAVGLKRAGHVIQADVSMFGIDSTAYIDVVGGGNCDYYTKNALDAWTKETKNFSVVYEELFASLEESLQSNVSPLARFDLSQEDFAYKNGLYRCDKSVQLDGYTYKDFKLCFEDEKLTWLSVGYTFLDGGQKGSATMNYELHYNEKGLYDSAKIKIAAKQGNLKFTEEGTIKYTYDAQDRMTSEVMEIKLGDMSIVSSEMTISYGTQTIELPKVGEGV